MPLRHRYILNRQFLLMLLAQIKIELPGRPRQARWIGRMNRSIYQEIGSAPLQGEERVVTMEGQPAEASDSSHRPKNGHPHPNTERSHDREEDGDAVATSWRHGRGHGGLVAAGRFAHPADRHGEGGQRADQLRRSSAPAAAPRRTSASWRHEGRRASRSTSSASATSGTATRKSAAASIPSARALRPEGQRQGRVTKDYRKLLDRKDVDAVVIATPDHWHAKQTIDAMEAGKDVYCEKPMTHTIDEARKVAETVKQTEQVFTVGVQSTADPRWKMANEMITAGKIGKVMQGQTSYYRNSDVGQWRYYPLTEGHEPQDGRLEDVPRDRVRPGPRAAVRPRQVRPVALLLGLRRRHVHRPVRPPAHPPDPGDGRAVPAPRRRRRRPLPGVRRPRRARRGHRGRRLRRGLPGHHLGHDVQRRPARRGHPRPHRVFSTMHTTNAALTIQRLIAMFPPAERDLLLLQLETNLEAVISQRLAKARQGGRLPVVEIMRATPMVRKLIGEGRTERLPQAIANRDAGMQLFDQHLAELYNSQQISGTEALRLATNPEAVAAAMRGISRGETSGGLVG